MRYTLPDKPRDIEFGVISLDSMLSNRTHWVCYYKSGKKVIYFDSYSDARPPKELVEYLQVKELWYNTDNIQIYDDPPICGHMLRHVTAGNSWKVKTDVISHI